MKHKGNTNEYKAEYNDELMRIYRRLISESSFIDNDQIFQQLVNTPTSRFWVSEFRAAIVISRMFRGDDLSSMRPHMREMYQEIYRRALVLRQADPKISYLELAVIIVNQPAPRFYMTPDSARVIVLGIRRRSYRSRLSRRPKE